jgi:hypothetical protein
VITTIPHARRMNLIALALFVTALVALTAFHLLPGFVADADGIQPGWATWTALPELVNEVSGDPLGMIVIASFLTTALVVLACPFIASFLGRSRIAWWAVTVTSGAAFFGFGGIMLDHLDALESGINCLAAAQALNFLGLLFIRREPMAELP